MLWMVGISMPPRVTCSRTSQAPLGSADITLQGSAEAISLGVSRQTVIAIEGDRYSPSLPLAFRIAKFFEVPVETMFDPSEEMVK